LWWWAFEPWSCQRSCMLCVPACLCIWACELMRGSLVSGTVRSPARDGCEMNPLRPKIHPSREHGLKPLMPIRTR
jgi:hypothetical protein